MATLRPCRVVLGEVDDGHAALADLTVETVSIGERDLEPVEQLRHGLTLSGREGRWRWGRRPASPRADLMPVPGERKVRP